MTVMGWKAELVMATHLILRHRSVGLVTLLAVGVLALGIAQEGRPGFDTVVVAGGSVMVVAASRVLARGPVILSVLRVPGSPWLITSTRIVAALGLVLPPTALVVAGADVASPARAIQGMGIWLAGVGALTAALAPALGASTAAALGLLGVWFGGILPSDVLRGFAPRWISGALVWCWNALPMPWRLGQWVEGAHPAHLALLLTWVVVAVALSGLTVLRRRNP